MSKRGQVCDFILIFSEIFQIQCCKFFVYFFKSNTDGLIINLSNTPKLLHSVRFEWAPQAFCVSFKLETDENILVKKALGAIQKYGVHYVCANILNTR